MFCFKDFASMLLKNFLICRRKDWERRTLPPEVTRFAFGSTLLDNFRGSTRINKIDNFLSKSLVYKLGRFFTNPISGRTELQQSFCNLHGTSLLFIWCSDLQKWRTACLRIL